MVFVTTTAYTHTHTTIYQPNKNTFIKKSHFLKIYKSLWYVFFLWKIGIVFQDFLMNIIKSTKLEKKMKVGKELKEKRKSSVTEWENTVFSY